MSLVPTLVKLRGGSFFMGGVAEDKFVSSVELPRHEVLISPFELGSFPITRGQWHGDVAVENAALPMTGVCIGEIQEFLKRLGARDGKAYRLPSEAEWEYACRAGSVSTVFPAASSLDPADANFLYDESGLEVGPGAPTPPGRFPANAFGLLDMLGNVCEWTADLWHPGFEDAPADGSPWMDHGKPDCRVIRGGAWDHLPRVLRASWRDWAPDDARWDNLGFRIALTL
jgi:formylglycine-generating enzyme required for sulfatase activity